MVDNNKEFDSIVDEDNFGAPKTSGIKETTMLRFNEALKAKSLEMNGGGERQIFHNGMVYKIFAPNTCEVYYNSVQALEISLLPKLMQYKDDKLIKAKYDDYKEHKKQFEKWIKEKREMIEEYSHNKRLANTVPIERQKLIYQRDIYRVELADELFEILSILMSLCNYFDESFGMYTG